MTIAGKPDTGQQSMMQYFDIDKDQRVTNYKPGETSRSSELLAVLKSKKGLGESLSIARAGNAKGNRRNAESRLYNTWTDTIKKFEYKQDPSTKKLRAELRPEADTALRFLRKLGGFNYAYHAVEDLDDGRATFDWLEAIVRLFVEVTSDEVSHHLTEYDTTLQVAKNAMTRKGKEPLHKGDEMTKYVKEMRNGETRVKGAVSKELRKLTKERHVQTLIQEATDPRNMQKYIQKIRRDVDSRDETIELLYTGKQAVNAAFAQVSESWGKLSKLTGGQEVSITTDDRKRLMMNLQSYRDDPGKRTTTSRKALINHILEILTDYNTKVQSFIKILQPGNSSRPANVSRTANASTSGIQNPPHPPHLIGPGIGVRSLRQRFAAAQSSADPELAEAAREAETALPETPQQTEALVAIQQTVEANVGQNRSAVNQFLQREAGRRGISKAGLLYLLATMGVLSTGVYHAMPGSNPSGGSAGVSQPSNQVARIYGRSYNVDSAEPPIYPRPDVVVKNNIRPGVTSNSYWSVPQAVGTAAGALGIGGIAGGYGARLLKKRQEDEENKRERRAQTSEGRNRQRREVAGTRTLRSQDAFTRSGQVFRSL